MALLKRIFIEYSIPLALAVLWALFSNDEANKWTKYLGQFSAAFFMLSFITGNLFRMHKQNKTEQHQKDITNRMEAVAKRLEKANADIIGYAQGAGYVSCDGHIVNGTRLLLHPRASSDYPVRDVTIVAWTDQTPEAEQEVWKADAVQRQGGAIAFTFDLKLHADWVVRVVIQTRTSMSLQEFHIQSVDGRYKGTSRISFGDGKGTLADIADTPPVWRTYE